MRPTILSAASAAPWLWKVLLKAMLYDYLLIFG